jgi:hypothetical protein
MSAYGLTSVAGRRNIARGRPRLMVRGLGCGRLRCHVTLHLVLLSARDESTIHGHTLDITTLALVGPSCTSDQDNTVHMHRLNFACSCRPDYSLNSVAQ